MKEVFLYLIWFCVFKSVICSDPELEEEELRARAFMTILNKELEEDANIQSNAEWDYSLDMSEEKLRRKEKIIAENSEKAKRRWMELINFNWRSFSDPDLRRQFMLHSILGINALPEEEASKFSKITADMERAYSMAKICDYKNKTKCDLALNPDIVEIHAHSRDEEELKHVWTSWRDAVGPHIRHLYRDYVILLNKAAKINNFNSADHMWLFPYEEFEIKDIRSQFKSLWEQVKPLYQQLHAFMRFKLKNVYGDVVTEKGPIPAHLLGDVWGQSWVDIGADFKPFPNAANQDFNSNLQKQNYSVTKMVRTAEEFFTSIGLSPMVDSFWEKSIFSKGPDRNMDCHATAWDFQNKTDYRIRMCATPSAEDFYTIHHEMGHIEYYMQYKEQAASFRSGANPGFHDAIGDLIALSVRSPKHLASLRLSSSRHDDKQVILNSLYELLKDVIATHSDSQAAIKALRHRLKDKMIWVCRNKINEVGKKNKVLLTWVSGHSGIQGNEEIGLSKIPFLPYSYLVDQWRWEVFSGNISFDDYNCKWWELRENIQGVEPPELRTEADFDPACEFDISNNMPYIRYFVAVILEFQIHRALCEKSGEYDPDDPKKPLHMCDIYNKRGAGKILQETLELGSSKPWPEVLHVATGQSFMDASAILEYFRPLQSWLEKENRKNDVHIGWEKSTKICTRE